MSELTGLVSPFRIFPVSSAGVSDFTSFFVIIIIYYCDILL